MPRNFISIVLLVVVIIGALWFIESPPSQLQTQPEPDLDAWTLVQYFNDMDTVQFNIEGLPENHFFAQRIEHHQVLSDPEAETTVLMSQPHFTFYEQGQARWEVQSDTGETVLSDEMDQEIYLQNNVRLQQITSNNPAQVTTNALWVNPEQQHAYTDDYVELRAANAISKGRGLDADVGNEVISILAETKSRYEKIN